MKVFTTILLTALFLGVASPSSDLLKRPTRYDDQLLIQIPNTKKLATLVTSLDLDVWSRSPKSMDVRVTPSQHRLLKKQTTTRVLDSNIQRAIDAETKMLNEQVARPNQSADWFTAYHRYSEIVTWMKELTAKYPDLVTLTESIGKTYEKRDIAMLKITGTKPTPKKSILFQSLQHAREWISTTTTQYIANELVTQYGKNAELTRLMDSVEFYIIPVVNPDGYEYSWTNARLQRKNRFEGYGVDNNRNWPDHWGFGGSSTNKNSDTYMGAAPGNTEEVQAVINTAKKIDNLVGFIDWHSYSELVLRPYSWTFNASPDDKIYSRLGDELVKAIKGVGGPTYTSQTGADLYIASGGADDYFYGNYTRDANTRRAYGITIELSPKDAWGGGGFILKPDRIIPVGKELMPAVVKFVDWTLNNPLATGRPW